MTSNRFDLATFGYMFEARTWISQAYVVVFLLCSVLILVELITITVVIFNL